MYSIISQYDIYCEEYTPITHTDISGKEIEYISYDGNRKITNLFSTNPARYLDKRYQPGQRF